MINCCRFACHKRVDYCSWLHLFSILWFSVLHGAYIGSALQVLVQGCQLDCTDLDLFLHQIYQQLRSVENNIAEVLQQQHTQARETSLRSFI